MPVDVKTLLEGLESQPDFARWSWREQQRARLEYLDENIALFPEVQSMPEDVKGTFYDLVTFAPPKTETEGTRKGIAEFMQAVSGYYNQTSPGPDKPGLKAWLEYGSQRGPPGVVNMASTFLNVKAALKASGIAGAVGSVM